MPGLRCLVSGGTTTLSSYRRLTPENPQPYKILRFWPKSYKLLRLCERFLDLDIDGGVFPPGSKEGESRI